MIVEALIGLGDKSTVEQSFADTRFVPTNQKTRFPVAIE